MSNIRWCVAWKHPKTGERMWCATYRGKRPSEDARSDPTACGAHVIMRIGSERRLPTCPDCKAKLKSARAERKGAV